MTSDDPASPPRNLSRRSLLTGALKAGAVATGALAFPWVWVPRRARAATGALHGRAKHVLILVADGGLRSTALFNADVALRWNPHRGADGSPTQPGAAGTEWGVGAVFDPTPVTVASAGVDMPALPAISDRIGVLTTVDHEPGAARSDASHFTARRRIATGAYDGDTGLLTQIYKHHPMYTGSGAEQAFPPVVIGAPARQFGMARPSDGARRPLFFNGPQDFERGGVVRPHIPAEPWANALHARLDDRFAAPLSRADANRVSGYRAAKRDMARFRDTLRDPMLQVAGGDFEDPTLGTNAMLREAMGLGAWGPRVALAVRMLQLGSPAVAVGVSGYDTHSNEIVDFPPLARELGRQLAALDFVLSRLDHPGGGTYLDHTLITVVSEFSRDNTEPTTGYNSAYGSDHRGDNGSRHQAIPMMGAGIAGGRRWGSTDAITMAPRDPAEVFASRDLLATLIDAVGVDVDEAFEGATPIDALAR